MDHLQNNMISVPPRKIPYSTYSNPMAPQASQNVLSICWYMSPTDFYEEYPTFQKIPDAVAFYVHRESNRVVAVFNLPEPIMNNPTPITEQKSSPIKMVSTATSSCC